MSRRGALHVTDGELRKLREPCPSRPCKGHAAQMVLSRTSWKECTDCGHQWRFRDASSKIITREQKDELVKPRSGSRSGGEAEERRVVARRREQFRQEMIEMKKSKKAAKGVGQKKVKKGGEKLKGKSGGDKRPSIAAIVRDVLTKNPKATDEQVVREFRKTHPDEKSGVRHVKLYRNQLGIKAPSASEKPAKPAKAKKPIKKPKKD